MQQYSLSLDLDANSAGALLMRDAGGAVRPASRREILRVARELVQADELRGKSLNGPDAARDFLRLRFNAALEHEVW